MKTLTFIDFNDQYHAIRRLWGSRSLNVRALLKILPNSDEVYGVAKAPSNAVANKFNQMLRHNNVDCSFIIGGPNYQTCTSLLTSIAVKRLLELDDPQAQVTVVTGSQDARYINQTIKALGADCTICGFSEHDNVPSLPVSCVTPVPLSHVLGVEHVVKFSGRV